MLHVLCAALVGVTVVALTFLPFAPGDYDPLAGPVSMMALVLGRVALVLVPVGGLWLWTPARSSSARPRWLIWLTLVTCTILVLLMALAAFATASLLLSAIAAAAGGVGVARLARRLRSRPDAARTRLPAAAWLVAMPIAVLTAQVWLAPRVTAWARDRAIAHAAPLIAAIEQYHARHGEYPMSLLAVWGDYKPSIRGIARHLYEPAGRTYNVVFEQPSLVLGTQEFVVFNPQDQQTMTSHAQVGLEFEGPALEARRGYYAAHTLPQPHWKVFLFD